MSYLPFSVGTRAGGALFPLGDRGRPPVSLGTFTRVTGGAAAGNYYRGPMYPTQTSTAAEARAYQNKIDVEVEDLGNNRMNSNELRSIPPGAGKSLLQKRKYR